MTVGIFKFKRSLCSFVYISTQLSMEGNRDETMPSTSMPIDSAVVYTPAAVSIPSRGHFNAIKFVEEIIGIELPLDRVSLQVIIT